MHDAILGALHQVPRDLDLVVGVPRSGMIAATSVALLCNVEMTDLDSYLDGRTYGTGRTKTAGLRRAEGQTRTVLVIDDSINSGTSMQEARQRIAQSGIADTILYAAVYGSKPEHPQIDFVFETVPWPRMFQWNFMHHKFLAQSCIDIDGVLCVDPTREENDDGPAYISFLGAARPLYGFSRPLGTLVTSRLEKYRPQTEAWLASQGIAYDKLVMLDLPSAEERRKRGAHGAFKGKYYGESDAILFIESENRQAQRIADIADKPVLCLETHRIVRPGGRSVKALKRQLDLSGRAGRGLRRVARRVLGTKSYEALKARVRNG